MEKIDESRLQYLREKALALRRSILDMIFQCGAGHPGGSLSAADIVAVLYFDEMRIDPKNPRWSERDRFVLSKGHACPVLYAALAERGFFSKEKLKTLRCLGSILQGHPDMRKVPGLDMTTGSLGQGLSVGAGMALGALVGKESYRTYVMVGDGEINEGQIWEAIMFAAKYRLSNLVAILDNNGLQLDGSTEKIMPMEPLNEKLASFNWNVIEIDGHDITQIIRGFQMAKACTDRPTWIIANTIKGKGVDFMENQLDWHGKAPNKEEYEIAIKELEGSVCQ